MPAALWMLALAAGIGITIQVGQNAALRTQFGSAGLATLVSFASASRAARIPARHPDTHSVHEAIAGAPWWAWFGGLFGAFYVAAVTIAGPGSAPPC